MIVNPFSIISLVIGLSNQSVVAWLPHTLRPISQQRSTLPRPSFSNGADTFVTISTSLAAGYDPNFTGVEIPLPTFDNSLDGDVLKKSSSTFDDETGSWREYMTYSVATNKARRQPICAALNVDQTLIKTVQRGSWKIDREIGAEFQLDNSYYRNNVWDRGHMARRATAAWGRTTTDAKRASDDTMYYSNASLQHMNLNQDEWLEVEEWVKYLQQDSNGKIAVFSGPIYGTFPSVPTKFIGSPPAEIPAAFYKVVSFLDKDGDLSTRAFIYLQDAENLADRIGSRATDYQMFQVSTTEVEESTGLIFPEKLRSTNPFSATENIEIVSPPGNGSPVLDNPGPPFIPLPPLGPPVAEISKIFVAAAFINPAGSDERSKEWISIANYSSNDIDLVGWTIDDQSASRGPLVLSGSLSSGQTILLSDLKGRNGGEIMLTNSRGSLTLKDNNGSIVDVVDWVERPTDGEVTVFNPF